MSGLSREMKKLVRQYRRAGWTVTRTKNSHWRFVPPDGKGVVFTGGSPSDWRSLENFRAQTRRLLSSKPHDGVAICDAVQSLVT